jgi:flagellum-specific ATP synthase
MLAFDMESIASGIKRASANYRAAGRLISCKDAVLKCSIQAAVGDHCEIQTAEGGSILTEVIGFEGSFAYLTPFDQAENIRPGMTVVRKGNGLTVPTGDGLFGRVIDGLGRPIDNNGPLTNVANRPVHRPAPAAMDRQRIRQPFVTGQRAIDAMMTCGVGQRVGIFAGSGVGKSTLLGEITKGANADVNVIALIGERGREVLPFLEDNLGEEGMARTVVVVATCDESPLMRVRASQAAIAIADSFRESGKNVLFMIDSLTRLAMAQREIGQMRGEVPGPKGYTPSCFQTLATTIERLGNGARGGITALLTVLVDGGDFDEPIADSVRSLVDGHIVLDRKIAEKGIYPAFNVLKSVSRVQSDIVDKEHVSASKKFRSILALLEESNDMIRLGMYTPGMSKELDKALELKPRLEKFLKQDPGERWTLAQTRHELLAIASQWTFS